MSHLFHNHLLRDNYLCTCDLYTPVHNVLEAWIYIMWGSWKVLGPGIPEFFLSIFNFFFGGGIEVVRSITAKYAVAFGKTSFKVQKHYSLSLIQPSLFQGYGH